MDNTNGNIPDIQNTEIINDENQVKEADLFNQDADILEDNIRNISEIVFANLLKDHTKSEGIKNMSDWKNIIWATNNYEELGEGYKKFDEIKANNITGKDENGKPKGKIIQPRALKEKAIQQQRSKDMAEVFTPAWVCNAQNNLIDNEWFGRENVFNKEIILNGIHDWEINQNKITFPEGKTWQDYVSDTRLEITCGEAPYLTSRYDVITGELIPVKRRIGLLDRKLRVVDENTNTEIEWLEGAFTAVKNIYGYEYQGDNLLLAREAILYTIMDYFEDKFKKKLKDFSINAIEDFSYIISWNIWQMDGFTFCIPNNPNKFCQIVEWKQQSLINEKNLNLKRDCFKKGKRFEFNKLTLGKGMGTQLSFI